MKPRIHNVLSVIYDVFDTKHNILSWIHKDIVVTHNISMKIDEYTHTHIFSTVKVENNGVAHKGRPTKMAIKVYHHRHL